VCFHVVFAPPQPLPSPVEQTRYWREVPSNSENTFIQAVAPLRQSVPLYDYIADITENMIWKLGFLYTNIFELISIVTTEFDLSPLSLVQPIVLRSPGTIHTTEAYLAYTIAMTATAYIRWACYRELGRHFTFELSIKKDYN
jgi:hypothetical protein